MTTKRTKQNEIAIPSSAAAAAPARRKSVTTPRAKHGLKTTAAGAPETKSTVELVTAQAGSAPTVNEIAALAYTYWVGRGCQGGSPEEDWLRAEQELRSTASA
jgi:hypothetical protein